MAKQPLKILKNSNLNILAPLNLNKGYDYIFPAEYDKIPVGQLVEIPLRNKTEIGLILGGATDNLPTNKMKSVSKVFDKLEPFQQNFIDYLKWVSDYTMSAFGNVFKMTIPVREVFEEPKQEKFLSLAEKIDENIKLTEKRRIVLEFFKTEGLGSSYTPSELAEKTEISLSVIKEMEKQNLLKVDFESIQPAFQSINYDKSFVLNNGQQEVVNKIDDDLKTGFAPILLDGITGSGKTEVYFKVINNLISNNKESQTLIMLPEISLTGQFLKKFNDRFGSKPVLWHSSLTNSQRKANWLAINGGQARVVVGTRSALFLPFKNLKLIIVDEEHDSSFKQEDNVIYHGRDMGIVRAKFENIPIILSSATPSLETIANAQSGKYKLYKLTSRFGNAVLPQIHLCDLRSDKPLKEEWGQSYLSSSSLKKIEDRLKAGEQIMLFLNRRGYAPLSICKECGYRDKCPNCDIYLTSHGKENATLKCHHCGYQARPRKVCPECKAEESFILYGIGVERLSEEIQKRFANKKVAILSSDTLNTTKKLYDTIDEIEQGKIDIIIGTQIFAKGHHFPNLTLVIIVDGDMSLMGVDIRAGEKTFALLNQVSGRAGRGDKKGEVVIQTFQPENKVMQALLSGDREAFLNVEIEERKFLNMPPFGRLAALILSSKNQGELDVFANQLKRIAPIDKGNKFTILGPADAPIAFLKGNFRKRFLIKTARDFKMQVLIETWLSQIKLPNSVKLKIDIDPQNFV